MTQKALSNFAQLSVRFIVQNDIFKRMGSCRPGAYTLDLRCWNKAKIDAQWHWISVKNGPGDCCLTLWMVCQKELSVWLYPAFPFVQEILQICIANIEKNI